MLEIYFFLTFTQVKVIQAFTWVQESTKYQVMYISK